MRQDNCKYIKKIVFWLINIILCFPLFLSRNVWHQGYDDYYLHNMFATRFWSNEGFQITHPMYAILVGGLARIFSCKTCYVAVPVLILAELVAIYVGSLLFQELDEKKLDHFCYLIMSFLLNIIQPIIIPGYIVGPNSANGYVSPTLILCKPFTLLVMYYFFKMYKDNCYTLKYQILLCVTMGLSSYIKPLFSMAFIPAIGCLLLTEEIIEIRKKKEILSSIKDYFAKTWPLFFNGIILIMQYVQNINLRVPEDLNVGWGQDAPIRFGLFYAWRLVVPSVAISVLLAYALPIIVAIIAIKRNYRNEMLLKFIKPTVFYGIVSFIYISCLYQEGFAIDLNFRNAWVVTFSFVYLITLSVIWMWNKVYFEHSTDTIISKIELFLVDGVLILHLLCGIALIIKNYVV